MNSKENSTGLPGESTVTCPIPVAAIDGMVDLLDARDGLISKTIAAKHLSAMLMSLLESNIGPDAGKPGPIRNSRTVIINDHNWQELQWLAAEVWDICGRTEDMIGALDQHLMEISNATYDARKALAS